MNKKAVKVSEGQTKESTRALVNSVSATSDIHSEHNAKVEDPFQGQTFESEDSAINFLLKSVVSRLGIDTPEGADMQDFLDMVLESDPMLREELLAGVSIRK
jgi:hypothetical protein